MDFQQEIVNNKPKQVFTKHGQPYTRKGYDIRVRIADQFAKKCDLLGENETKVVEKLVEAFVMATGWGDEVKSAPFEERVQPHVNQAAKSVLKDMFPWFNSN